MGASVRLIKQYLMKMSKTDSKPSRVVRWLTNATQKFPISLKSKKLILLERFVQTTSLPPNLEIPSTHNSPALEILFVCTAKDFEVLPEAIECAVKATNAHPLLRVSLVVPAADFELAQNINLNQEIPVVVLNEERLLAADLVYLLRSVFKGRAGWVIQQLLKVEYVSNSTSPAVLVCDADTLLLTQRFWFDASEKQILTPSWEWKQNYYVFLAKFGLTNYAPKYTFVSHHMLMQPKFLREAKIFMGWKTATNIVEDLIAFYDGSEISPFCIEYELYAQFLYKNYPDNVVLSKWANLGVKRIDFLQNRSKFDGYASISLHDYL
jgi:hypothetical protein